MEVLEVSELAAEYVPYVCLAQTTHHEEMATSANQCENILEIYFNENKGGRG